MRKLEYVSSKDENWTISYLQSQSKGLSEIACEETDPKLAKWKAETISLARQCRKELYKRFNKIMWGSWILNQDGTLYHA